MKRKIIIGLLTIVFLILGILSVTGYTKQFDDLIYKGIIFIKSDTLTYIVRFITSLANTQSIIFYNIIILIIILVTKKTKLLMVPINSILSIVFNNLAKIIFRRNRPELIYALIEESGYSYPSGHAMISVLFYGTLFYLIKKSKIKYKNIVASILLIFILLVGSSRIYLGVHYASDIIGGYILSTIILMIDMNLYNKRFKE